MLLVDQCFEVRVFEPGVDRHESRLTAISVLGQRIGVFHLVGGLILLAFRDED